MKYLFTIAFLLLTKSLYAQEYMVAGRFDVRPSWEDATVYISGKIFPTNTKAIEPTVATDVVVFMHGCTGIKGDEVAWAKFLNDLGYLVVLPNSLAIKGRVVNCSPSSFTTTNGSMNPADLFMIRAREFRYSFDQLRKNPNVGKIFLAGFSEGAVTVHFYRGKGLFTGLISISSFCRGPVSAPRDAPILTIDYEQDPYFPTKYMCEEKYGSHDSFTKVILDGGGHEAARNKKAEQAVKDFLSKN